MDILPYKVKYEKWVKGSGTPRNIENLIYWESQDFGHYFRVEKEDQ